MTNQPVDTRPFDVFADDGTRIVSLSFSICFFTGKDFTSIPDEVIFVFNKYFETCDRRNMKFYRNENMSKGRRVTEKTFDLLAGWLRTTGAGRREMIHIFMQDGETYASTPDFGIIVSGVEDGMSGYGVSANLVRMIFPAAWVSKCDEMFSFACHLAESFPVTSGLAGFNLEVSPYHQSEAHLAAWRLSSDHPCLDISRDVQDRIGIGQDGIKGVNWLTILSSELAATIGGESALATLRLPHGNVSKLKNGASVIRACPAPVLGVSRAEAEPYREVFRLLKPLVERTLTRFGAFSLPGPGSDKIQKTDEWLMRLS